ncbi:MAG TPA: OmpA family protein [Polyangiaceae bacterium]
MSSMFCRSALLFVACSAPALVAAQTEGEGNFQLQVSTDEPARASASATTTGAGASAGEVPYMQRYVPEANLWELGLFGTIMFPSPSHRFIEPGSGLPQQDLDPAAGFGVRFAYFPLAFLGLEIDGAAMPTATEDGSSAGIHVARGHLIGQLPGSSVTPFVLFGMGALGATSEAMGTDTDPAFHFGGGVKAALDAYVSARLDVRDSMTQRVGGSDGHQTHHPEVMLGLTFTLERTQPDRDGDGFADHRDDCVDQPGENQGCPGADTDGDGVPDSTDECKEQAGAAPHGCPDSDADGVLDSKDACPEQAGVAPHGCPGEACPCVDTDADGVTDANDKCPKEPARTVDGCPIHDQDGDGIDDDADKCPKEPETKNGFEDADGCPDEIPEEVKRFSGVIEGITFDYNSDQILPAGRPTLDAAAKTFKEHNLRVLITGHTDNQGERDYNVDLSARRAASVKKYLVAAGVPDASLQTRGAGPDEPRADNATPAGQQKNRRIEFKILSQ